MIKISTNQSEFFSGVEASLEQLLNADKVLRIVSSSSVALISNRVQQKGLKTDEKPIGKYSEKTLNFGKITSRFQEVGNKKQISKRLKNFGDTTEFYGGYKEFRKELGRQTDFIDLTLSGDMMNDFSFEATGKNEYSVGFLGIESGKIASYHEKRFGEIFSPSESEKDILTKELNNGLSEAFK